MEAMQSVPLYGEEVWADALDKEVHRPRLAQVQRPGALRVTPAYRTVSEPAMMAIAGVIVVILLAKERKATFRRKGENLKQVVAREERQRTLTKWQLSWQNEPRGRWTARLIDNLDPWLNQAHGQIDYFLAQLLSGHGRKEVFSLTCTGLGRCDLLIVCSAMKWRTMLSTHTWVRHIFRL